MLLFLFVFITKNNVEAQAASRPTNIIFIIGDDISWNDIGAYGNSKVKTPNLDKMAKAGLKLTNMFLTASSCSPSRTSIFTGRYPHNTGAAELHTPLPAHLKFFPEMLKELQKDAFTKPRAAEEFFDNFKDPSKVENLVKNRTYSKQLQTLKTALSRWQAETGDTEPEHLTPDWYDRETGEALPAKDKRGEMPGAARKADRLNARGPF